MIRVQHATCSVEIVTNRNNDISISAALQTVFYELGLMIFTLVFCFYHTELFFGPMDSITNNTSKYDFPNLPRSPPEKEVPGFWLINEYSWMK